MKNLFYDPIKIKHDPSNILFWGCLHINHDPKWDIPLWKQRGFSSVEEHNTTLINNWNSKANDQTIGFLLGDTMFGYGGAEKFTDILFNQLVFKEIYLMPGNHFAGWRQAFLEYTDNNGQVSKVIYDNLPGGMLVKTVHFVPNYLEAFINTHPVVMSHYPLLSFNGQGGGAIHLFAHVHGSLNKSKLGGLYIALTRCWEVSVEVNPFPITWTEILEKLKDKPIKTPDQHGPHTANPF